MARKRQQPTNGAGLGFEEKLWLAADKLRGHMDAAEYKHVVLARVRRLPGPIPELRTHAIHQEHDRDIQSAACAGRVLQRLPSCGAARVAKKFGGFARLVTAKMLAHDEESATLGVIRQPAAKVAGR